MPDYVQPFGNQSSKCEINYTIVVKVTVTFSHFHIFICNDKMTENKIHKLVHVCVSGNTKFQKKQISEISSWTLKFITIVGTIPRNLGLLVTYLYVCI